MTNNQVNQLVKSEYGTASQMFRALREEGAPVREDMESFYRGKTSIEEFLIGGCEIYFAGPYDLR